MGAIANGLAGYGGFIPFGFTFLVFSDCMRPPICPSTNWQACVPSPT